MGLLFNGNEPENITFNGNNVSKVVYNRTIVWEKQTGEINYIEYLSGDNEYLNTETYPTENTKIEFQVSLNSNAQYRGILGCRNGNSFACFTGRLNQDVVWRFDWGTSQFNSWYPIIVGQKRTITIDKNKMYIDGTLLHTYPEKVFVSSQPIYIFSVNDNGIPYAPSDMNIYSCKVYENDILIRDFRPCIDSNNTECLYDEVSKSYFYKQAV